MAWNNLLGNLYSAKPALNTSGSLGSPIIGSPLEKLINSAWTQANLANRGLQPGDQGGQNWQSILAKLLTPRGMGDEWAAMRGQPGNMTL
jgi:hypothetical protein